MVISCKNYVIYINYEYIPPTRFKMLGEHCVYPNRLTAFVNLSNQARGDCLSPYSDFLNLNTELELTGMSNPGGILHFFKLSI